MNVSHLLHITNCIAKQEIRDKFWMLCDKDEGKKESFIEYYIKNRHLFTFYSHYMNPM